MSKRKSPRRKTNPSVPYGTTGDRNPFTYGGGIVYVDPDSGDVQWTVFPYAEEDITEDYDDDKEETVYEGSTPVFSIDVPKDILDRYDWADFEAVADSIGSDYEDLAERAMSDDPMARVSVLEDISGYYGYNELDSYASKYSMEELLEAFESDHEKALAAENARMVARVEAERSGNPRKKASAKRSNPEPAATSNEIRRLAKRLAEGG